MRTPMLLGCLGLSMGLSQAEALLPDQSSQRAGPQRDAQLLISRDRDVPRDCAVELQMAKQRPARLSAGESLRLKVPPGELSLRVELSPANDCGAIAVASSRSILINPGETQRYRVMLGDQSLFLAPQRD